MSVATMSTNNSSTGIFSCSASSTNALSILACHTKDRLTSSRLNPNRAGNPSQSFLIRIDYIEHVFLCQAPISKSSITNLILLPLIPY
jgi:hypothetical protein